MAATMKRSASSRGWRADVCDRMKLSIGLTIFLVILIGAVQMFYLYLRLEQKPEASSISSNAATPHSKSSEPANPARASARDVTKSFSLIMFILFNCLAAMAGMLLNFVGASYLLYTSGAVRRRNLRRDKDWKYSVGLGLPGLIAMGFGTILLLTTLFSTTFKIDALAKTPDHQMRDLQPVKRGVEVKFPKY
jgi:hypothetical protein